MAAYRVFVDANVWYPPSVRALMLGAALAGVCEVVTSQQVLEEVHRHLTEQLDEEMATLRVQEIADTVRAARHDGVVDLDEAPAFDSMGLPDPDDEHVVAAALAAEADGLLTFNLKDFPADLLARAGLELCPPDEFAAEGLRVKHPRWVEAVAHALTFPPRYVASAADLGLRLDGCLMPHSAGALLTAGWPSPPPR